MKHNLTINVSKKPKTSGIVKFRNVTIRERFLRLLFGDKQQITIVVPGNSVSEVAIKEIKEGGKSYEQSKVTT